MHEENMISLCASWWLRVFVAGTAIRRACSHAPATHAGLSARLAFLLAAPVLCLPACSSHELERQNADLQGQVAERDDRIAKLEAARQAAEERAAARQKAVEELQGRLAAEQKKREEAQTQAEKNAAGAAALRAELRRSAETLEQTREKIDKLQKEIEDLTRDLERERFQKRSAESPDDK